MNRPQDSQLNNKWLNTLRKQFVRIATDHVGAGDVENVVQEAMLIVVKTRAEPAGDDYPALTRSFHILYGCIEDYRRHASVRSHAPTDAQAPSPTSQTVADVRVRMDKYLAGTMPADERAAFEDQILSSDGLVDRLYFGISTRSEIAAGAGVAGVTSTDLYDRAAPAPWWQTSWWRWLVPALAVALLAVIIVARGDDERPRAIHKDTGGLHAISPLGNVDAIPTGFTWAAHASATQYRFELYGEAPTPVFSTVTADTFIAATSHAIVAPDRGYWVVTPLNELQASAGRAIMVPYRVGDE